MTAAERSARAPVRVLVVTDLGPAGAAAIAAAAAQVHAHGGRLAVMHAIPPTSLVRPLFPHWGTDDPIRQAELPMHVRAAIEDQVAAAVPDGVEVDVFVESGGDAESALARADAWDAGLIVVGPTATTGIDAERIVRHAHTPVLVVRPGPAAGPIVACTDFSDPALPAVAAAAREARRTGARLDVVHALEPIPISVMGFAPPVATNASWEVERRRDAEQRLDAALAALEVEGEAVVVDGPVIAGLVEAAEARGARMLVVGTVGRTGLTRFLLGSTAEALVRSSPCSTLVVRLHRDRSLV
ncbi:MAG: universal stress protein [Myxococcales bacterium]|nr:universal stress protein [Myxococcales bacterium]